MALRFFFGQNPNSLCKSGSEYNDEHSKYERVHHKSICYY